MPWKESVALDERLKFVRDAPSDRFAMSELCARWCSTGAGVVRPEPAPPNDPWTADFEGGAAGDPRRARLHHHWLTQSVTHVPDTCVPHVPG